MSGRQARLLVCETRKWIRSISSLTRTAAHDIVIDATERLGSLESDLVVIEPLGHNSGPFDLLSGGGERLILAAAASYLKISIVLELVNAPFSVKAVSGIFLLKTLLVSK
jgi:hypothetical protein